MYQSYFNKFIFRDPFVDTLANRADVVHEATHAVLDMNPANRLQILDNEFLAFLSEAIALDTLGYAFDGSEVFGLAAELAGRWSGVANEGPGADRRLRQRHRNRWQGQNPVLRLREAIRHHPNYITDWWGRYRNDGA